VEGLAAARVEALIVIGGNGSQAGAHALGARGVRVVGVASTIDNDLVGCDVTIGATTAVDVALEAIDRLKVTAASHHRAFLVEVMGRDCGNLALMAGLAGGAEAVAIPEVPASASAVAEAVRDTYRRGKAHALIVVAEGVPGGCTELARQLATQPADVGFDVRVTRIGHVQRGGAPAAFDRRSDIRQPHRGRRGPGAGRRSPGDPPGHGRRRPLRDAPRRGRRADQADRCLAVRAGQGAGAMKTHDVRRVAVPVPLRGVLLLGPRSVRPSGHGFAAKPVDAERIEP
jgi:hypothetical protein